MAKLGVMRERFHVEAIFTMVELKRRQAMRTAEVAETEHADIVRWSE